MTHTPHRPTYAGPLVEPENEEERELMDPESWDWDGAEVIANPVRVSVEVVVRLSTTELAPIARRARELGIATDELARRYLLAGAAQDAATETARPTVGT